jgi:hypothetical protein
MDLSLWMVFGDSMQAEKSLQSRTAWGPFFERKTRKMRPHGGRLVRDFSSVSDTSSQQNAEFMYHKTA